MLNILNIAKDLCYHVAITEDGQH